MLPSRSNFGVISFNFDAVVSRTANGINFVQKVNELVVGERFLELSETDPNPGGCSAVSEDRPGPAGEAWQTKTKNQTTANASDFAKCETNDLAERMLRRTGCESTRKRPTKGRIEDNHPSTQTKRGATRRTALENPSADICVYLRLD